jgi:HAMP domain-containing protein
VYALADVRLGNVRFTSIRGLGVESARDVGRATLREAAESFNMLGERTVRQKAEEVAREIGIYARVHSARSLRYDERVKEFAEQRFGQTGYTVMYDSRGMALFHPNAEVVGTNLRDPAQGPPEFVGIVSGGIAAPSSGYYTVRPAQGPPRRHYMAAVPVKGPDFVAAAIADSAEFAAPLRSMASGLEKLQDGFARRYTQRLVLFAAVVLVDLGALLAIIYLYASSIVRPIRHLAQVADRVSMGDLDAAIDVKGKGEVTLLAESIERMRVSVKAALERLQRRREGKDGAAGTHH